jgi:DNA topoisomerase IB
LERKHQWYTSLSLSVENISLDQLFDGKLTFQLSEKKGNTKYVFLAAGSSLGGQSDLKKFEKARKLKDIIDDIRNDYRTKLKDRMMAVRQRATAMYLIDNFALRAGNDKAAGEEADTVGCCSLRNEHITLDPPCTVTLDFLGKDSIRFFNKFEVDEAVFKNLKIFTKNRSPRDQIFDRLTVSFFFSLKAFPSLIRITAVKNEAHPFFLLTGVSSQTH